MSAAKRKTGKERLRAAVADEARRQLGKPYVYGARWQDAPKWFDCSSLVQYVYKRAGIRLPRVSIDQARQGRRLRAGAPLRAGDLIFLRGRSGRYDRRFPRGIGHVVLVSGPDEVIHAKFWRRAGRDAGKVVSEPLSRFRRRPDITVIKRII